MVLTNGLRLMSIGAFYLKMSSWSWHEIGVEDHEKDFPAVNSDHVFLIMMQKKFTLNVTMIRFYCSNPDYAVLIHKRFELRIMNRNFS